MCFSEQQSYLNAAILLGMSYYARDKWQLSIPMVSLAIKDLIQGLIYHNINNKKILRILTSLSWIHVSFQPLFVNMFVSYFDKNNSGYWNMIYLIAFIYGLYTVTELNEFDIQDDPDCQLENTDFCAPETTSYIGKYHVGYQFSRDEGRLFYPILYFAIMLIPALLTIASPIIIVWAVFILSIYKIFPNIRDGEQAAIWCFSSLIYAVFFTLFSDQIKNVL